MGRPGMELLSVRRPRGPGRPKGRIAIVVPNEVKDPEALQRGEFGEMLLGGCAIAAQPGSEARELAQSQGASSTARTLRARARGVKGL